MNTARTTPASMNVSVCELFTIIKQRCRGIKYVHSSANLYRNIDAKRNYQEFAVIQIKGGAFAKLLLERVLLGGLSHSSLCNLCCSFSRTTTLFLSFARLTATLLVAVFFVAGALAIDMSPLGV